MPIECGVYSSHYYQLVLNKKQSSFALGLIQICIITVMNWAVAIKVRKRITAQRSAGINRGGTIRNKGTAGLHAVCVFL